MDAKNYIKIEDLENGHLYKIMARNASYGIWIKERQVFLISRHKFGLNYLFEEYHWDCPEFGTAQPLKEISQVPFSIDDLEKAENSTFENHRSIETYDKILKYLNDNTPP